VHSESDLGLFAVTAEMGCTCEDPEEIAEFNFGK